MSEAKLTHLAGKPLTVRELAVLHAIADGRSNADIGRLLFVGEDTVKTHARRIYGKLGARDRAHAVHIAHQQGLIPSSLRTAVYVLLDEHAPVRAEAPDGSRFARLYDDLAAAGSRQAGAA